MTFLLGSVLLKLLQPVNLLSIIGGAAAGYMITHVLTNVAIHSTGTKVIPNFVMHILRILGAIVLGWVVALYVLGMGGGGLGGEGGMGMGEGSGTPLDPGKKDEIVEKDSQKDLTRKTNPDEGRYLYIEVLMNDEIENALGKEAAPKAIKEKQFYREAKSLPTALLTIGDIRDKLSTGQPPYKKLYVVLGKARSDPKVARVADLEAEAKALKIPSDRTSP